MSLHIYNTLRREKEEFKPLKDGRVSMYVCGPTVYGHSHIGHAKSYVSFDIIVRWLRHLGYNVKYVQNITDVGHLTDDADFGDDKIETQAAREHKDPMEIAQFYTRSFYDDMDALGVLRPNIAPTAAGHIPEQIEMIQTLIRKGNAYEINGSVYFDVSSFKNYGKLSGRINQEELESGKRVQIKSEKKNSSDFALWKKAEANHIMKWNSPWGVGFPGWHIECSAMSMKYLGESFDIHGGGLENQFPHHECEIAQSESATGKPFARYWIHNNMVTVNGVKMGKSLGNFTTIKDALKKFDPLVIRFFILQSHYRSTLDFSDFALQSANIGLKAIHEVYYRLIKSEDGDQSIDFNQLRNYFFDFKKSMDDDFNSGIALASVFEVKRIVNAALDKGGLSRESKSESLRFFQENVGNVLGLLPDSEKQNQNSSESLPKVMDLVMEIRKDVRTKKDFTTSDLIRDRLKDAGIEVKDTKEGATWRVVS